MVHDTRNVGMYYGYELEPEHRANKQNSWKDVIILMVRLLLLSWLVALLFFIKHYT
jgi:hypothetical protein